MPNSILLIDEHTTPHALLTHLQNSGYHCVHAKGPLKVRELLRRNDVGVIVWRQQRDNKALVQDLAREWSRHPEIPIVHLYKKGLARPALPKGVRLWDSIPSESAGSQLLELLADIFASRRTPISAVPAGGTELAFRNLVSRLRNCRGEPQTDSPRQQLGEFQSPNTALNPSERELLLPALPADAQSMWSRVSESFSRAVGRLGRRGA